MLSHSQRVLFATLVILASPSVTAGQDPAADVEYFVAMNRYNAALVELLQGLNETSGALSDAIAELATT